MIAITGASGHLGKATIQFLVKKINPAGIIAIVRDPAKIQDIPGIQIRVADYDDPASLAAALTGVEKLLQISSASYGDHATQQEKNVVDAAKAAGVKHVVYTGTVNQNDNPIFYGSKTNLATEKAIQQSGLAYTFFRNSMYMETIPLFIGSAMEDGQIHYPAGSGAISFVARTDIAEGLSNVLAANKGHVNAIYNITGNKAYTFSDIAGYLQSEKGLPATYTDIPAGAYRDEMLKLEMPEFVVDFYISMAESVKSNEFSHVDDSLESLLQRKRLSLQEYVKSL